MADIKQLSTSVINKIAAGEVIERPASVVKELMENCLDALATRIDVSIEKGGSDLIRISDNGHGIKPEQMILAVTSHATSKIRDSDDLFHVASMGFRGEALASISEVSHFIIRSKHNGEGITNVVGSELEINGGHYTEVTPCGCPDGTSIEVRDLFFNTPVRRKFLRTTQTEFGHISEAFTRIALGHPTVHFTLSHNNKVIQDLPPTNDLRERIGKFFGIEIQNALIPVSSENNGIRLNGYVVDPTHSRSHKRMQYLFLNGRHIRDRSLQHALTEAYRGLLLHGRNPLAFLHLEMPAELVDVNVHPAKLEVRFQDSGSLYSQLLGTLRTLFLSTDLTAKVANATGAKSAGDSADSSGSTNDGKGQGTLLAPDVQNSIEFKQTRSNLDPVTLQPKTGPTDRANLPDSEFPDFAVRERNAGIPTGTGQTAEFPQGGINGFGSGAELKDSAPYSGAELKDSAPYSGAELKDSASLDPGRSESADDFSQIHSGHTTGPSSYDPFGNSSQASELQRRAQSNFEAVGKAPARALALQVHNKYLITETDDGMVVIDQHALHERIIYEQIREKVLNGKLEKQRLLVPEPVNLSPSESATAMENRELLAQLGIEIEPFGGDTLLVSSYPAMLRNLAPGELLRNLLEKFVEDSKKPDARDVLDELLHMISCKAAIKAGDRLSAEEIELLLENRHYCQDAHHCPHGRPTSLFFSKDELDRRFKRI